VLPSGPAVRAVAAGSAYTAMLCTEYGRLPGFVAFAGRRYDKVCCMLDLRQEV
jgi:hypothetical protein